MLVAFQFEWVKLTEDVGCLSVDDDDVDDVDIDDDDDATTTGSPKSAE
jgi:hypothetical protein